MYKCKFKRLFFQMTKILSIILLYWENPEKRKMAVNLFYGMKFFKIRIRGTLSIILNVT